MATSPTPHARLPWSEVCVWIEEPGRRSVCVLRGRRAIVALARWKGGDPPAHIRYFDLGRTRLLTDPTEVEWTGFAPILIETTAEPWRPIQE